MTSKLLEPKLNFFSQNILKFQYISFSYKILPVLISKINKIKKNLLIIYKSLTQTDKTSLSLSTSMYQQDQQTYFGQQLDQINQIYIKTSYGNIFAHCVGKHGQPLIIVVHGSGPKNSGDQYLYFLHEYLVRVSYIEKFFIIAIDCPGYGRSKGSKQAVKTFPLQMFKQILQDLRYDHYYAMLGHSQGGAAIFNAVYEDPKLTQFLLMDRPVCGNIKRFSKFPIPTLLLYDIQDDGHPIWQGKLLYKELANSQLYTYRNSQYTYWVPDHIWNKTLSLFKRYSSERKTLMTGNFSRGLLNHRSQSTKNRKNRQRSEQQKQKRFKRKAQSLSKCEQIKKQRERSQKDLKSIKQIDKSEIYSKISDLEEFQDLPVWLNQPKIQQTQEQIIQQKQMKKKQQQRLKQKIKVPIVVENSKDAKDQIKLQKKQLKVDKPVENKQKTQLKKQKTQVKQSEKPKDTKDAKDSLQEENKCSICLVTYYSPIETNCKHIFCKKCLGQALLVDQRCPLCRTKVTKKQHKEQLHNKILQKMQQKQKVKRSKQLKQFETMLKSIIYIQLGNNSRELATKKSPFTKTKTKYIWQVYLKQPKNFKFEQVSFNINMGDRDSRPVRVTHAPFVFQSRGTFSFSCEITIKPKNNDYAPITSIYRIDVSPGNHSKIIALKKKKN